MRWMTSRTAENHGAFLLPYLKPGLRLLDCGCGPGTLTLGFARYVAPGETVGIDQEGSQFASSVAAAKDADLLNLHFETGDIYQLPYADACFDVVFASAVLGSVAEPAKVMAEMMRVLKPGGVLALKEFDHGGDIIYPQSPVIARSIALYHRLRAHNGHEPVAGRRLREFLHGVGCRVDYMHAYFDKKSGATELRPHIDRNNYLIAEVLGPQYLEHGWCTQAELDAQHDAWEAFASDPTALYLAAWFEAVGIKP